MANDHLFPRFSCSQALIHDVISSIIYCLINAVDGCGDHATTKPVDVWLCMVAGGQSKMEYSVPEFILDIYACLYDEVDLHVMYARGCMQMYLSN